MTLPKWLITVTPFSKYLALSLFIILPTFSFILGAMYTNNSRTLNTETTQRKENIEKTVSPVVKENKFQKRLFDQSTKVFLNDKSPKNPTFASMSFLQYGDSELMKFNCTDFYEDNIYGPSDKYFYLNEFSEGSKNTYSLSAATKEKLLDQIRRQNLNQIFVTQFCEVENGSIIITYGSWENLNIAVWDGKEELVGNNFVISVKNIARVQGNKEGTYHRCRTPLLLTKSNVFILGCDSTNGIVSKERKDYSYIYSIDLSMGNVRLEKRCVKEFKDSSIQCN